MFGLFEVVIIQVFQAFAVFHASKESAGSRTLRMFPERVLTCPEAFLFPIINRSAG